MKLKDVSLNVKITDSNKFQQILIIFKRFIEDERVPANVKDEYKEKLLSAIESKS